MNKSSVSIIIPHLKGRDVLIECLESIYNYTQNIQYEIIVIDNNVQDGSLDDINKKFPDLKIIASKENKGYAGGCNLGAQNAQSEYLLFLNNDTIIQKNTIENLLSSIQEDSNISSVQPKIKNYYNQDMFDYAGGSGGYIDYLVYPFSRGRVFNSTEKDTGQYNDKRKIFWASGTAFITKKEIFNKINGFDETLFAHMEEIDYHWKCLYAGYDIYVEPKSIIYHKGATTLPYGTYKKIFLNHRNSLILLLTNSKDRLFSKIINRSFLEVISFFYYLMQGKIKGAIAVAAANIWIFLNIIYLVKRRKSVQNLIKSNHKISEQLIKSYSIVKKYFIENKRKYEELS